MTKLQNRKLILEILDKMPIIQVACEKVGIARSTYYRWCKQSPDFEKKASMAIRNGLNLINDMAESQLISAIRNQNLTAVMYWLNHRHGSYNNKIEISTKHEKSKLSKAQEKLIMKALEHASLLKISKGEEK